MRPSNSLIVNGISNSASFSSSVIWATDIVRGSAQVVVSSGSCVGTFVMQGSNDIAQGAPANQFIPTNWTTIGSVSTIACSTTATSRVFLIPAFEVSYEYLKVLFTDASSGAANGVVSIRFKSLGL